MVGRRAGGAMVGLILCGLLASAPEVLAGRVAIENGRLGFDAGSLERNNIFIFRPNSTTWSFGELDPPPDMNAGAGCKEVSGTSRAECAAGNDLPVSIDLGSRDDRVTIDAAVAGSLRSILIDGGSGDDVMIGGPGPERFIPGPGRDVMIGRGGFDIVLYTNHPDDMRVTFDDVADDGPGGGEDNIGSDVEGVETGTGDDVLIGNAGPNHLNGGGGTDLIIGGGGIDSTSYAGRGFGATVILDGQPNDGLAVANENDNVVVENVSTGKFDDTLVGDAAPNEFDSGDGEDSLTGGPGRDRLLAGADDDEIFARDGESDFIDCGPPLEGFDIVDADLQDEGASNFLHCERVTVGALREGPNLVISRERERVLRDGSVRVEVQCPAALPSPCAGRMSSRLSARGARGRGLVSRAVDYAVAPGARGEVAIPLGRRARSTLRRRGRARLRLRAVERGDFGPKTTIQTLSLHRRLPR